MRIGRLEVIVVWHRGPTSTVLTHTPDYLLCELPMRHWRDEHSQQIYHLSFDGRPVEVCPGPFKPTQVDWRKLREEAQSS